MNYIIEGTLSEITTQTYGVAWSRIGSNSTKMGAIQMVNQQAASARNGSGFKYYRAVENGSSVIYQIGA